MSDELVRLAREVERLRREVRNLETRLAALESQEGALPGPAPAPRAPAAPAEGSEAGRRSGTFTSALTLSGRTFLVLGGGLLLRALTDAGLLTPEVGVAAGLGYALAWVAFADRKGKLGQGLNAAFHAVAAVLIAYPLLWEATTKLRFFTPYQVVGIMALCTALGLAVAWRRRLRSVAWLFTLAPLALTYALVPATRSLPAFAGFNLLLGLATVWLAYERDWRLARWPVAVAADGLVLLAVMWASQPGGPPVAYRPLTAGTAEALALALPVIYLGSAALRTLARRREVSLFEAVQGATSLFLGFGGSVRVARAAGGHEWIIALVAMGTAAVCYTLAFTFVDRSSATRRNFYYYGWLALGLVLLGSGVMAGGLLLPVLWGGLAVAAAVVGTRYDRFTLRVHGAVYAFVAAVQGGLLAGAGTAFLAPADRARAALPVSALVVLGAVAVAFGFMASIRPADGLAWHRRLPRFTVGTLLVIGVSGGAVSAMVSVILRGPGPGDPAVLAVIRTGVLALAAVVLAFVVPRTHLFEMGWLVPPLIILGGVKFLAEDLPHGRPATLFPGLACYGIALIGASRILRSRRASPPEPAA